MRATIAETNKRPRNRPPLLTQPSNARTAASTKNGAASNGTKVGMVFTLHESFFDRGMFASYTEKYDKKLKLATASIYVHMDIN